MRIYTHVYESPIGNLHVAVDRHGQVVRLGYLPPEFRNTRYIVEENKYACGEVEHQLDRYFAGDLRRFSVGLRLEGTEFQKAVWNRLLKIKYGTTMTYGQVAQKIGRKDAARAVGNAVANNPIPILVPCHRVLPASGEIGSYAVRSLGNDKGSRVKRILLELEGIVASGKVAV
jgi:methylated-DNA-[protein]-cysteine S-methyltransferase